MIKTCNVCFEDFPATVECFHRDKHKKDGLHNACKICRLKQAAEYRKNHVEERKKYRDENKEKTRFNLLLKTYGISREDYKTMNDSQNGVCAICGFDNNGKPLYVDHDHRTNKIRGLLCQKCNTAIGLLYDDPDIIKKAAKYLENRL